jgi:hypothetical protein
MERIEIEEILAAAERTAADGDALGPTGFWRLVSAVKADPSLVDEYAQRIARIDRESFANWAVLSVPLGLGTSLMVLGTAVGLGFITWAYYLVGGAAALVFLAGFGALLVTTHGLGHLIGGSIVGIRFTSWFIGSIGMPQPGVKIDYASYLRAPAVSRAWMHASGAIATKVTPFLLLGAAIASGAPSWVPWLVGLMGVGMVMTDVLWSTKSSDWMKFRREMKFAQRS